MYQKLLILVLFFFTNFVSSKISQPVYEITSENYDDLFTGEWLVKFHAPWCPACQRLEKHWDQLAEYLDPLNVNVGSVDVTEEPELNGRFMITSLPTIYHFKNGVVRYYNKNSRSLDDLFSFIEDAEYDEITPVSWYSHPNSAVMKFLGKLYKFSFIGKEYVDKLSDLGYSNITIYALIGSLTVLAGLGLGLIMVAITDFVWPMDNSNRRHSREMQQLREKKEKKEEQKENKESEKSTNEETDEKIENNSKPDQKVRKRTARKAD